MSDGELKIDDYHLINCIATGSSTQIWEVKEQGAGQSYAMKLLLPEALKDQEQVRVLKSEAKTGKVFDHPNLVKVHFSSVNRKRGYMIMDHFRAPNLKTQIHSDLPSLQARIRKLIESTVMGLGHIHERGWVHRDIKPDNILFNKGGELRIIDFSLSKKNKRKHKDIQGTKSYIAPETLLRKVVTGQADMYSFGITIYLILTGDLPITGVTPSDLLKNHIRVTPNAPSVLNPNVTPEMDMFVMKMIAKKPKDRFKSMTEVYAEFRNLKIFHEDVEVLATRKRKEEEQELIDGIDAALRLDSRADAERSKIQDEAEGGGASKPALKPKPKVKPKPKPAATPQPAAVASPAPQPAVQPVPQPAPPQGSPAVAQQQPFYNPAMPPQAYPQQPGIPPYGITPGQPYPPGMIPGQPVPQGVPLQMPVNPAQQMPVNPAQQMPVNPVQSGMPPGTPQANQSPQASPVPPEQAASAPANPSQPAAPVPQPPSKPPTITNEEMDFMDELPDVV